MHRGAGRARRGARGGCSASSWATSSSRAASAASSSSQELDRRKRRARRRSSRRAAFARARRSRRSRRRRRRAMRRAPRSICSRSTPEDEALAAALVGDAVVVDDLADRAAIAGAAGAARTLVTRRRRGLRPATAWSPAARARRPRAACWRRSARCASSTRSSRELERATTTRARAHQRAQDAARRRCRRRSRRTRKEAHQSEIAILDAEKDLARADRGARAREQRLEALGRRAPSSSASRPRRAPRPRSARWRCAAARETG